MEAILGLDQQDFPAFNALYLISGVVSVSLEGKRWARRA
jgi:hypothetical protein